MVECLQFKDFKTNLGARRHLLSLNSLLRVYSHLVPYNMSDIEHHLCDIRSQKVSETEI